MVTELSNAEREIKCHTAWYVVREIQKIVGVQNHYLTRKYPDIFWAVIDTLASCSDLVTNMQALMGEIKSPREALDGAPEIASRALKDLPLKGRKMLEIGGPFGRVLHALGADAWCVDPDIDKWSEYHRGVNWYYRPAVRPECYHPISARLAEQNWQDYLAPEAFDVVFTNMVLDESSGTSSNWRWRLQEEYPIEASPMAHIAAFRRVAQEVRGREAEARKALFTICAEAVGSGGAVIHQGGAVEELIPLSSDLGLKFLEGRSTCNSELGGTCTYIFRKLPNVF